jgi:hypothetical protein
MPTALAPPDPSAPPRDSRSFRPDCSWAPTSAAHLRINTTRTCIACCGVADIPFHRTWTHISPSSSLKSKSRATSLHTRIAHAINSDALRFKERVQYCTVLARSSLGWHLCTPDRVRRRHQFQWAGLREQRREMAIKATLEGRKNRTSSTPARIQLHILSPHKHSSIIQPPKAASLGVEIDLPLDTALEIRSVTLALGTCAQSNAGQLSS